MALLSLQVIPNLPLPLAAPQPAAHSPPWRQEPPLPSSLSPFTFQSVILLTPTEGYNWPVDQSEDSCPTCPNSLDAVSGYRVVLASQGLALLLLF